MHARVQEKRDKHQQLSEQDRNTLLKRDQLKTTEDMLRIVDTTLLKCYLEVYLLGLR